MMYMNLKMKLYLYTNLLIRFKVFFKKNPLRLVDLSICPEPVTPLNVHIGIIETQYCYSFNIYLKWIDFCHKLFIIFTVWKNAFVPLLQNFLSLQFVEETLEQSAFPNT